MAKNEVELNTGDYTYLVPEDGLDLVDENNILSEFDVAPGGGYAFDIEMCIRDRRYTVAAAQQASFYQLPKFLFAEPYLSGLSNDGKILYALLRDRHSLSLKNGWVNNNNEIFILYSRDVYKRQVHINCKDP